MLQPCPESDSRPGVVLVARAIVRTNNRKILLVRRALNDRRHAGLWEVPGGKVEKGQDLATALEEELAQETGLIALPTAHCCAYDSPITEGRYAGSLYLAVFFVTDLVKGDFRLSDEHCDYAWVDFCEYKNYDLTHETKYALSALGERLL